jgi:hypothetical protein
MAHECKTCKATKPADMFYDGHKYNCKECTKRASRNAYHAKRIQQLENSPVIQKLEDRIMELETKFAGLDILEQKVTKLEKLKKRES